MSELIGGSPYGASTLAGGDGSRQPSENEIKIARFQGTHVAQVAKKQTATDWRGTRQKGGAPLKWTVGNITVNSNPKKAAFVKAKLHQPFFQESSDTLAIKNFQPP